MAANDVFEDTYFETSHLSKIFLERVRAQNEQFDESRFLSEFASKTSLHKVNLVLEKLLRYDFFPEFADDMKDDSTANRYRLEGNAQFQQKNYLKALEEYTNAVAHAKTGHELALAYGNRSACLNKLHMRKQCLEEIDRALAISTSAEHKKKLTYRRKQALRLAESKDAYYDKIPEIPESLKNPLIWCASECVRIESDGSRRYIVATRDLQIGEVISVESPYACTVFLNDRMQYCHHCLEICYNLIPCERCTQALFCCEKCRSTAQETYHTYECKVLLNLNELAVNNPSLLLAVRITIVAIDDYLRLRNFECDHRKYYYHGRYNEIHSLKPEVEPVALDLLHEAVLASYIFQLLWTKTNFLYSVPYKYSFRDKFKEVILDQLIAVKFNAVKIYDYVHTPELYETDNFGFGMYSFFSLFTHSCCANTMKTYHGTTMVMRALNTIKKGEECFVNRYGIRYDAYTESVRDNMLIYSRLPKCKCIACRENWIPSLGNLSQICKDLGINNVDFGDIVKELIGADLGVAKKHLPRLTELLKECEEHEPSGNALTLKRMIAHCYVVFGNKRLL